jgi:hypothetical protein
MSACTGDCAIDWPPLTTTGTSTAIGQGSDSFGSPWWVVSPGGKAIQS